MKPSNNLRLEFLFLLLAAVLVVFILFPIVYAEIQYPFYWQNALLIIIAVFLIKHIFLLKHSWLNKFQKVKIVLIPLCIPLIIYLMRMLNQFTTYIDEVPLADLMTNLSYDRQLFLTRYIRVEFIAWGVMAIVGAIILPFKLIISIWREVNRPN